MSPYKPQQRSLFARVFTTAGWLEGNFHLAAHQGFAEFLSKDHVYYRLTDVKWPGAPVVPFLALHHTETLVVLPDPKAPMLHLVASAPVETLHVVCLMPGGWVEGEMEHLVHLRLSDTIERLSGYVVLEKARLWPRGHDAVSWPVALVNAQRIVGVSGTPASKLPG